MGKRSLVLAATLVLVVSMGLPVIAHGAVSAPSAPTAASVSHAGTGVTATVKNAATTTLPKASISPHPGYLVIHEVTGSGALTMDPAAAYDTVSFEPILNTYETLIAYNGSTTASFVPVLSTCVPSTVGCTVDYGSSLVVTGSGPFAGQPIYWTFPMDPNAKFFDPSTGNNWSVTPTDVMFSIARTLSFSNLPFVASQNGWIAAQTLLPLGNPNYDFNGSAGQGIHFPFNNTPFNVLSSMLINDSTYCPASALAQAGCITFVADGLSQDWPFFLQIVADALGASVVSCGVFTHNGAGLPGFNVAGSPVNGDGPCTLPGGATSTTQAAFQNFLTNPLTGSNGTYWDDEELLALNAPGPIESFPYTNLVGSGAYQAAVSLASGYTLKVNPAYSQPIGCSGGMAYTYTGYCYPAAHSYIKQVNVTYDSTDTNSINDFGAGTIDAGGIFPSHTVTNLVPLVKQGKVQYTIAHTLSNFFFGYADIWSQANYATDFPSEPTPNLPQDFFSNNGVRNFFTESYPFLNVQNQILTVGGIQYAFDNVCGPIPLGMGNYYPTNLSCPGGNPDTNSADVGGAAWWWAQLTNPSSIYYDAEVAACVSHQCTFPIVGEIAAQQLDAALQLWINEIYTLSGHAIKPFEFDLSFHDLIVDVLFSLPGQSPVPVWNLGWAPDYPDPTDYTAPYVIPEGTYTVPDAVALAFGATNTSANQTFCGHDSGLASLNYWAYNALSAFNGQIPTQCEGIAYDVVNAAINTAAPLQDSPYREGLYNAAEHILTKLSLYVWFDQANSVPEVAPWIDINSVNTNPTIGGGGDQPFFQWRYNPPNVINFKELKLPIGVTWAVQMASPESGTFNNTTSQAGTASTGQITVHTANGTQNFAIIAPSGYGVVKITGPNNPNQTNGTISGGAALTWTVMFGPIEEVLFYENTSLSGGKFAMYSGALWSVDLVPSLTHGGPAGATGSTTGTSIPFFLPKGAAYKFTITAPSIYKIAPPHGGLGVPGKALNKLVKFILLTVVLKFHETGLTFPANNWTVTLTGASGPASPWFLQGCGGTSCVYFTGSSSNLLLKLPAGTYNWTISSNAKTPTPLTGTTVVPAPPHTALSQNITFA